MNHHGGVGQVEMIGNPFVAHDFCGQAGCQEGPGVAADDDIHRCILEDRLPCIQGARDGMPQLGIERAVEDVNLFSM